MPRLFSAYVIVDWSAASKPNTGADSVWIGVLKRDVRFRLTFACRHSKEISDSFVWSRACSG